jgi:hypothetical protein
LGDLAPVIEAGGKALSFFVGFDLLLVVILILGIIFQMKVLPKIIDKGFKKSEKNTQMFTKDILRLTIYSSSMPILIRLEAAYDYFRLGGNGLTKEFAMTKLILPNRELWETIVARKREASPEFDVDKTFEQTMLEIKTALA